MSLLVKMFHFVNLASFKYKIDESHSVGHSMNILHFAHKIFQSEQSKYPELREQERIVYMCAVLHDMCDKKYMNEEQGIMEMEQFLAPMITAKELSVTKQIISTMSYSKVKKQGFPKLDAYTRVYHIVREADLLCAYDFDRSMIYHMNQNNCDVLVAFENAHDLFQNRMFRHHSDGLFTTEYAKIKSTELEKEAYCRIQAWKEILTNDCFDTKK